MPASQSWEIRTDTGNDNNGGGYDPAIGTSDYTYPTSSPIAYSDLVIAATTTNVSSAARAFVAADVGNTLNLTAVTGFTAGRYSVRSVAGGVATLDRAVGTAGSTSGAGRLGGALATPAAAIAAFVLYNTIWIRQATYTIAASLTDATAGDATSGINRLMGYGTVRGDNGQATLQLAAGAAANSILFAPPHSGWTIQNLIFDCNAVAGSTGVAVWNFFSLTRCKVMNWRNAGASSAGGNLAVDESEFTGGTGTALYCHNNGVRVFGSYIHDLTGAGIDSAYYNSTCIGNVISNVTNTGLTTSVNSVLLNNTVRGCGWDGIYLYGDTQGGIIHNNLIDSNGGYGINLQYNESPIVGFFGNAFRGNTSGATQNAGALASQDITVTADPFVNAAGLDFRLNNAAGGGALLRGTGMPSLLPGSAAPNSADVGGYRHATPPLALAVNSAGANPVLTWDADSRAATGYVISRGTTATNKADIATVALATTTYTDTTATSGTFFYGVASY